MRIPACSSTPEMRLRPCGRSPSATVRDRSFDRMAVGDPLAERLHESLCSLVGQPRPRPRSNTRLRSRQGRAGSDRSRPSGAQVALPISRSSMHRAAHRCARLGRHPQCRTGSGSPRSGWRPGDSPGIASRHGPEDIRSSPNSGAIGVAACPIRSSGTHVLGPEDALDRAHLACARSTRVHLVELRRQLRLLLERDLRHRCRRARR